VSAYVFRIEIGVADLEAARHEFPSTMPKTPPSAWGVVELTRALACLHHERFKVVAVDMESVV
jgi:hypothetical protein